LIDITKNAQNEMIEAIEYEKCNSIRTYRPKPVLDLSSVKEAADLINSAKKPYILAGQGILLSDASEELKALSEKTGIPVACTLLGLGNFPTNHPNYVGFLGMHGNYGPNVLTNECDVLIAIGMRFDDRVTGNVAKYAKQAKVIHIEIDKAEINKIITADVAVHADAKEALRALIDQVKPNQHKSWLAKFNELNTIERTKIIEKECEPDCEKLTMGEAIYQLSRVTNGEAILVTDVGQHQMTASRYYQFKTPHTNVTSGGAGTMGFALPAALGAKTGVPEKEVVAVIGDGGYQMTVQELGTIMQYEIPVKIMVLNNSFLGMVRQWQQLFHEKRYSFTEMTNPNFVKLAEAYNIPAKKVEKREDLADAIKEMMSSKTAYFLEVVVGKEDNVFPMVPAGGCVSDVLLEAPAKK
jgi:acetolactate synthase-1/2/3 large subunit